MMKYIDLLNRFWEANRADRFTTAERELYYYLLNECNHNYWRMPVSCSTSVVCAIIGMNRATLVRAREGLRRRGLIRFEEGVQNSRAPTYTILDTTRDTGNATASATAGDTAGVTARATSYTTQKSNTNTFPDTDALLPIDELERRLLADTEWHEQIVRQLAANGKFADADTLADRLRRFFDYLRICKYEKREEKECRSHFYNKLLKEYPKYGTDKQNRYDRRRGAGSRLLRRKITTVHFRLPMSIAQASNALLAAVQAEVAYRRRTFSMTDALSGQIGRMAAWLTGDSSKFAAVLCGGCGNGKTTLVKAFQNLLCYLNIPVPDSPGKAFRMRLCDAKEIADIARTDYPAFLTLARTPMLAIDDVGIEPLEVMEYGNVVNPITELLTKRYNGQLFTLMTTNLTPDGIRKRYGDRIADRLNEMAVVIPFKNPSYRTDSASLAE